MCCGRVCHLQDRPTLQLYDVFEFPSTSCLMTKWWVFLHLSLNRPGQSDASLAEVSFVNRRFNYWQDAGDPLQNEYQQHWEGIETHFRSIISLLIVKHMAGFGHLLTACDLAALLWDVWSDGAPVSLLAASLSHMANQTAASSDPVTTGSVPWVQCVCVFTRVLAHGKRLHLPSELGVLQRHLCVTWPQRLALSAD